MCVKIYNIFVQERMFHGWCIYRFYIPSLLPLRLHSTAFFNFSKRKFICLHHPREEKFMRLLSTKANDVVSAGIFVYRMFSSTFPFSLIKRNVKALEINPLTIFLNSHLKQRSKCSDLDLGGAEWREWEENWFWSRGINHLNYLMLAAAQLPVFSLAPRS